MIFKRVLKIFLVVFLAATLVYIFSGLRGKSGTNYMAESRPDGEGMVFASFNEDNKKALELKCSESHREEKDRIVMKKIEGLIFKKGRMHKNIKIFGEEGFVENNFHSFFIEKNARLMSEDFTVTSDSFTLKDRAELKSAPEVAYFTSALKGTASAGMELYLNVNTLKFYDAKGAYRRKQTNQTFDYEAKVLWFIEKQQWMVLEMDAVIKDDRSILRSDWISIKFTEDLKQVTESSSQKNSYLYIEDKENGEIKEIKGENIKSFYDADGHMTQLMVLKNAEILLKDQNNRTSIVSDTVEMNFDGPSGKAVSSKIPLRGKIENTGKTKFFVIADTIDIQYNTEGELRHCEGSGNVQFIVEEYKGTTAKIVYNIEKDTIVIEGENSKIDSSNNTFTSSGFKVDVKNKILSSNQGVKSIVLLDKGNVLFSEEPIFINAKKFAIFEKEGRFSYEKQVNLTQANTSLEANSLEIQKDNTIIARGGVSLSFKNGEKEMAVKGAKVTFNPAEKRIDIVKNAVIKSDENVLRALTIVIRFDVENRIGHIRGEEDINFIKEDLSGTSQTVEWLFQEELMTLKGSPRIVKQSGGKTSGRELTINLKNDIITILSDESSRTETVIK